MPARQAGLGREHGLLGTLVNTFGGRWFDMDWKPQLNSRGVEEGDRLVCRHDEEGWTSGA